MISETNLIPGICTQIHISLRDSVQIRIAEAADPLGISVALKETESPEFTQGGVWRAKMHQIVDWRIAQPKSGIWGTCTTDDEEFTVRIKGIPHVLFNKSIYIHTPEFIATQIKDQKLLDDASRIMPGTPEYHRLETVIRNAVPHVEYLKDPQRYGIDAAVLAPMSVIENEPEGRMSHDDARKSIVGAIRLGGFGRLDAYIDTCSKMKERNNTIEISNDFKARCVHTIAVGRILDLGDDAYYGEIIGGKRTLRGFGKFFGAPKNIQLLLNQPPFDGPSYKGAYVIPQDKMPENLRESFGQYKL